MRKLILVVKYMKTALSDQRFAVFGIAFKSQYTFKLLTLVCGHGISYSYKVYVGLKTDARGGLSQHGHMLPVKVKV